MPSSKIQTILTRLWPNELTKIVGANATIGIEFGSPIPTPAGVQTIQKAAPHARIVDSSGIIEELRAVKSPVELKYMQAAGEISGNAIRVATAKMHRGTTNSELAANLIGEAIRQGSEPMSLGPYVTTGKRSFMAHSSWVHVPILENELINTEIAAVVNRYNTPVFRVSVIGKPSDDLRRFHDASQAGLRAGMEKIRPGMTSHEGDKVVRDAIAKAGFSDYFPVRAAYSIGVGFPPMWSENHVMSIRPNDQRVPEPRNVLPPRPGALQGRPRLRLLQLPNPHHGNGGGSADRHTGGTDRGELSLRRPPLHSRTLAAPRRGLVGLGRR